MTILPGPQFVAAEPGILEKHQECKALRAFTPLLAEPGYHCIELGIGPLSDRLIGRRPKAGDVLLSRRLLAVVWFPIAGHMTSALQST